MQSKGNSAPVVAASYVQSNKVNWDCSWVRAQPKAAHTHARALTHPLAPSLTLAHARAHTRTHTHRPLRAVKQDSVSLLLHAHTHTHCCTHTHTHSITHSLALSPTHSLPDTHTCARARMPSRTHSHTPHTHTSPTSAACELRCPCGVPSQCDSAAASLRHCQIRRQEIHRFAKVCALCSGAVTLWQSLCLTTGARPRAALAAIALLAGMAEVRFAIVRGRDSVACSLCVRS